MERLSVYINTQVEMSQEMMDALTRFEVINCALERFDTEVSDVKVFLAQEYGQSFADQFKAGYLHKSVPHVP